MSRVVPAAGAELVEELVLANRILSDQTVLDAFGHISVRHDKDPSLYLLSQDLAPALVTREDLVTFDLDSVPVANAGGRYYSERFIHGEIYKARPDVNAVIHCHPASLIPFSVSETKLRPIYHMGAFLGAGGQKFCAQPLSGPRGGVVIYLAAGADSVAGRGHWHYQQPAQKPG